MRIKTLNDIESFQKLFSYKYKNSRNYDEFLLFFLTSSQHKEQSDNDSSGHVGPRPGLGGAVRRWRTSSTDRSGSGDLPNKQILRSGRKAGLSKIATVVILLLAVPCTPALIAENSNSFLFAATAVFALLVKTNIPWNAPPVCPLNWLMSTIVTASLLLMKIFAISFCMTAPYSTAFSILSPVLFHVCFLN